MTSATASSEAVSVSMKKGRVTTRHTTGVIAARAAFEVAALGLARHEVEGAAELAGGLVAAAQPGQHLGAGGVVQVALRQAIGGDRVERRQAGVESVGEADRHRPVEGDDRTLVDAGEHAVEVGDLAPVGLRPGGSRVVRLGDRRLQLVRPDRPPPHRRREQRLRPRRSPPGPTVVRSWCSIRHQLAAGVEARRGAGVLGEHQRQQPEHLGLVGHQLGELAPEPDRLVGEVDADRASPAWPTGTPR